MGFCSELVEDFFSTGPRTPAWNDRYIVCCGFIFLWRRASIWRPTKVQVTGGSTYTVSLPKEGDGERRQRREHRRVPRRGRTYCCSRPRRDDDHVEGTLDIAGLEEEHELTRAVMTMYVSGFDVIRLETTRITPETAPRDPGRHRDSSAWRSSRRPPTTSRPPGPARLLGAVGPQRHHAHATGRAHHARRRGRGAHRGRRRTRQRRVIQRDDDVDRLWYMVSRVFRTVLPQPHRRQRDRVPRETVFDYQSSARQNSNASPTTRPRSRTSRWNSTR